MGIIRSAWRWHLVSSGRVKQTWFNFSGWLKAFNSMVSTFLLLYVMPPDFDILPQASKNRAISNPNEFGVPDTVLLFSQFKTFHNNVWLHWCWCLFPIFKANLVSLLLCFDIIYTSCTIFVSYSNIEQFASVFPIITPTPDKSLYKCFWVQLLHPLSTMTVIADLLTVVLFNGMLFFFLSCSFH